MTLGEPVGTAYCMGGHTFFSKFCSLNHNLLLRSFCRLARTWQSRSTFPPCAISCRLVWNSRSVGALSKQRFPSLPSRMWNPWSVGALSNPRFPSPPSRMYFLSRKVSSFHGLRATTSSRSGLRAITSSCSLPNQPENNKLATGRWRGILLPPSWKFLPTFQAI